MNQTDVAVSTSCTSHAASASVFSTLSFSKLLQNEDFSPEIRTEEAIEQRRKKKEKNGSVDWYVKEERIRRETKKRTTAKADKVTKQNIKAAKLKILEDSDGSSEDESFCLVCIRCYEQSKPREKRILCCNVNYGPTKPTRYFQMFVTTVRLRIKYYIYYLTPNICIWQKNVVSVRRWRNKILYTFVRNIILLLQFSPSYVTNYPDIWQNWLSILGPNSSVVENLHGIQEVLGLNPGCGIHCSKTSP